VLDPLKGGQRVESLGRGVEDLRELLIVQAEAGRRNGDGEILFAGHTLDERAVNSDLELLTGTTPDLDHGTGRVRAAREDERQDRFGAVRLRPAVVQMLTPRAAKVCLGDPLVEDAVEPPADVEQLVLDTPPRCGVDRSAVVLVVQVAVVANERLELFSRWKRGDQSAAPSAWRRDCGSYPPL
jgi:hypothetical protein